MTRFEQLIQDAGTALMAVFRGPAPSDDAGALPTDLNGLRGLLRIALGQPVMPTALGWEMSNNRLANRLTALEQLVTAKFADSQARLDLANAALASQQATNAAQDARLDFLTSKDALMEAATAANTLDIAAQKRQQQADEAAQALLAARLAADEATIATLQSKLEAAQYAASQAQATATTANTKADTNAAAVLAAKAAADAAAAKADAAQASFTALATRFRTVRVATPQVAINGTMSVAIAWPTPFADANYNAVAEFEGLSLLGLAAVVTSRTATGCTVTSKNVLGLVLAAGAGTLTVTAIHD